jgi:DNA-binding beta-propeller fold protein YncE
VQPRQGAQPRAVGGREPRREARVRRLVFSGTIGVFHRDAITGELTQLPGKDGCVDDTGASGCANGRSLTESIFVRVSPDGNHVYATARKSNSVTNNPGCARGRALDGAYSVTVKADRGRENVYVTSRGNDGVATFKRVSGGLRHPPGPAGCITNNTTADCTRTGRGLNGSASLAVAANGRDVYVAAYQSFAVSRLRRDTSAPRSPSYGRLSFVNCRSEGRSTDVCRPSRGLLYAHSVALSPDQRNVYVAGGWSNALAIFQRPRSGALHQVGPARGRTWSEGCISWRGHKWDRSRDLSRSDHSNHYCARALALWYPEEIEVSSGGDYLYVASRDSDSLTVLKRLAR